MKAGDRHLDLAVRLHQAGDLDQAARSYRAALSANPALAEARALFGVLHAQQGAPERADGLIRSAIAIHPGRADFHAHLGGVLAMAGKPEAAIRALRRALRLQPANLDARTNLGQIQGRTGELEEAVQHLQAALTLAPAHGSATHNLADALRQSGRPSAAKKWATRAALLMGGRWEALLTLAQAHSAAGDATSAAAVIDQALRQAPADPGVRWAASLIYLGAGRLATGWPLSEARFAAIPTMPYLYAPERQWRGQPIVGRRLLVWWEQGIGDEIIFASCIPDLRRTGAKVTIGCDQRLAPLWRRSFPETTVIPADSPEALRAAVRDDGYDFHIPSGALPPLFRRDLAAFPSTAAWLCPDMTAVAAWRARLDAIGTGPRVGVLWRGLLATSGRSHHYQTLSELRDVFAVPGIQFIELQYGDTSEERRRAPAFIPERMHRFADLDLRDDFDGVAALMSALDLVIGPNTAAITLAGALGRPVWNLARGFDWLRLGTQGYPWAPSIRCFLAEPQADWTLPIREVADALGAMAAAHR